MSSTVTSVECDFCGDIVVCMIGERDAKKTAICMDCAQLAIDAFCDYNDSEPEENYCRGDF